MNEALARAVFVSGTPLNIVQHPLWIEFFKRLRPSFVPPTRRVLSSSLLENEYSKVNSDLCDAIANAPNLNLQCDGWSNIRNEAIINFVISKPQPLFVEFLETKTNNHSAEFIAGEMAKVIDKYGAEKFFVAIGDNENTMQAALRLLQMKFPWIVPLGCISHWLHLFCKDIMKCKNAKKLVSNAMTVVKTVKMSHVLNGEFKNKQKEKGVSISLKLAGKTRWGSILFCLESLQKNKSVLQSLAVDEHSAMPIAVKRLMLSEAFWKNVEYSITIFKPIVSAVTSLESDESLIYKMHTMVNNLVSNLNQIITTSKFFTAAEQKHMSKQMSERKAFTLKEIHLAAAVLNPRSLGHALSQSEKIDAFEFIYKTAINMKLNDANVMEDLANYQNKEGMWAKPFIWVSVDRVSPTLWWKTYASQTDLGAVAVRILSAPITSAATERSFSTFSWIHNKKRNRLTTQRAGKLTYIAHNWRLLNVPKTQKKREDDVGTASGGTGIDRESMASDRDSDSDYDEESYSDLDLDEDLDGW